MGGFTDRQVVFPDLASIYTIARSQLEAYLNLYYLYLAPQSDAERKLKYNIYVVAGLTVRQTARTEFEELYEETQNPKLLALIAQIQHEAERIAQLRTQIEEDPLFNRMYSEKQRSDILSSKQPRARTQNWHTINQGFAISHYTFCEKLESLLQSRSF